MQMILSYLDSKVVKHRDIALNLLTNLMKTFGPRKLVPTKFQKQVESMVNSIQPKVRNEALKFYTALFLWIGDEATLVFADKLK